MYTVVTKMKAVKGKDNDVEKELHRIVPLSRAEKGNTIFIAHRSFEDPCVFLTYARYGNKECFASHRSSQHMKSFFRNIDSILDEPPEINTYESLD